MVKMWKVSALSVGEIVLFLAFTSPAQGFPGHEADADCVESNPYGTISR